MDPLSGSIVLTANRCLSSSYGIGRIRVVSSPSAANAFRDTSTAIASVRAASGGMGKRWVEGGRSQGPHEKDDDCANERCQDSQRRSDVEKTPQETPGRHFARLRSMSEQSDVK